MIMHYQVGRHLEDVRQWSFWVCKAKANLHSVSCVSCLLGQLEDFPLTSHFHAGAVSEKAQAIADCVGRIQPSLPSSSLLIQVGLLPILSPLTSNQTLLSPWTFASKICLEAGERGKRWCFYSWVLMFGRSCAGSPACACFAQRPEALNSLRGDFHRLFAGVVVHGGHSSWFSLKNLSLSHN